MQGVGPGSLLGGRYLVGGRVSVHPRFERWTASDQALVREVVLLCFPARSPVAAAAVDSARRAAGVEEPRLVRVLDVGESDGVSFVVEEPLSSARSLATLVATGGLPSEEARRLVGEAASALETARIRGLHHGALGARSVLVQGDGAIKVRGLATEAALLGLDETDSRTALRTDAVALVALTYAALTGRWPLPPSGTGDDPGLEAAPSAGGGAAAPSELVTGVPADLDTLVRLTLNHDQGPRSPGDLAAQLAPWSPTAYAVALARPAATPDRASSLTGSTTSTGSTTPAGVAGDDAVADAGDATSTASVRRPGGRTVLGMAVAGQAPDLTAASAGRDQNAGPVAGSRADVETEPDAEPDTEPSTETSTEPSPERDTELGEGDDWAWERESDELDEPHEPDDAAGAAAEGRSPGAHDTGSMRIIQDVRLSDTLESGDDDDDDLEPPVPLGSGGGALGRDQSKIALVVVAVLVVVAAVIGVANLTRDRSTPPQAEVTIPAVVAPTTTPAPTTSPSTPSTATAAPSSDIAITNAQAWDPQGDGKEGNASAPRAYDGDPATVWRSQSYQSADFGGYAKSGVGLVFDLGQETEVHRVVTTLRGGADFTVYLADRLSLDGATAVGSSSGKDGSVTLDAPGGTAKGTLVIVWFTRLAPDGAGAFSAQVAEVKVS